MIKSRQIIEGGDAGGVYIPRKIGNADPNLHYGIVIDCGSSGSRLYIYIWPEHSGKENELLQIKQLLDREGRPIVKKIEPGIDFLSIAMITCSYFFYQVFHRWQKHQIMQQNI